MNSQNDQKRISKFLSYVLRHHPDKIGLDLSPQGWANVDELLSKAKKSGMHISVTQLREVVQNNDKQRFSLDEENNRIRANQGHSINIDLELSPVEPPEFLFHGTVNKFLPLIQEEGLKKMNRQHVHLSKDRKTATVVGERRGKPIILQINSKKMNEDGLQFFLSENGVWLTDHVPANYIDFPTE